MYSDRVIVNIKNDYSRHPTDGEEFRKKILEPILYNNQKSIIQFERGLGISSFFLKEAFGNLKSFDEKLIRKCFQFQADDLSIIEEINKHLGFELEANNLKFYPVPYLYTFKNFYMAWEYAKEVYPNVNNIFHKFKIYMLRIEFMICFFLGISTIVLRSKDGY